MSTSISESNPVRVFISHDWAGDEHYQRVFEYLESSRNFFYRNCSTPDAPKPATREAERESLRAQISQAEAVILLAAHHRANAELVEFMAYFAKSADKPVIVLRHFGVAAVVPKVLTELADELLEWDERALTAAIRRQARHEDTTRWDVVEFKLD